MIPDARKEWMVRLACAGLHAWIGRRFHGLAVSREGEETGRDRPGVAVGGSLVVCANHTNWWDGFVALLLSRAALGRPGYLAQEEQHLARYRFLRHLGAFGLDLASPRGAVAGLRHGLELLRREPAALWIFPQGRLQPAWEEFAVKPGATWLSGRSGARLLPAWIEYAWRVESRPGIYVALGETLPPGTDTETLRAAMLALRDRARARLAGPELSGPGWRWLIGPGRSVHGWWDAVRGKSDIPPP